MKTKMTKRMSMRMCCCCSNMLMMRYAQKGGNQHIINIYKERKKHVQASIPDSIDFRAAA